MKTWTTDAGRSLFRAVDFVAACLELFALYVAYGALCLLSGLLFVIRSLLPPRE